MDTVKSQFIDCMKFIGIVSVVAGHLLYQPFNMYSPYTFHMPLFFILGGMLYDKGRTAVELMKGVFRRHVIYIFTTYIVTGAIGYFLNLKYGMFLGNIFNDTPWETLYYALQGNMHTNLLFATGWFLVAYCIVSVSFGCFINISHKINDCHGGYIACIVTLLLCFILSPFILNNIAHSFKQILNIAMQVIFGGVFFTIGYAVKDIVHKIINPVAFILSFVALLTLVNTGNVSPFTMAWSKYPNGVFMQIVGALLCIYGIAFVSYSLSSSGLIGGLAVYIGRNSRSIMSYHICVFVFLDLLFYYFGYFDIKTATIENHYLNAKTWTLYFVLGVMIPISIRYLIDKTKPMLSLPKLT